MIPPIIKDCEYAFTNYVAIKENPIYKVIILYKKKQLCFIK